MSGPSSTTITQSDSSPTDFPDADDHLFAEICMEPLTEQKGMSPNTNTNKNEHTTGDSLRSTPISQPRLSNIPSSNMLSKQFSIYLKRNEQEQVKDDNGGRAFDLKRVARISGSPTKEFAASTKKILIESGSEDLVNRLNEEADGKHSPVRFLTTFEHSIAAYVVDYWGLGNECRPLKTANYYKAFGLGIPMLYPSFLQSVTSSTHHSLELLERMFDSHRITESQDRENKEPLFRGTTFMFPDNFVGFKLSKEDIGSILRLSGGTLLHLSKRELLRGLRDDPELLKTPNSTTVLVTWRVAYNQALFQEALTQLGWETIHVKHFLNCIEKGRVLPLPNKYKFCTRAETHHKNLRP